jgi:hypothetical protein
MKPEWYDWGEGKPKPDSKELDTFVAWLESLENDWERKGAIAVLNKRVCLQCGSTSCLGYCTRDD